MGSTWSTELPKESGWYGWRRQGLAQTQKIVEVNKDMALHDPRLATWMSHPVMVTCEFVGGEWWGPIQFPVG